MLPECTVTVENEELSKEDWPCAETGVVGIGKGGCRAVRRMKAQCLTHADVRVDYVFIDVASGSRQDSPPGRSAGWQASVCSSRDAGSDAGGKDDKDDKDGIRTVLDMLARKDLVFVVCCLEGEAEISAASFAAEGARSAGALTVGFALLPPAEGDPQRSGLAKDGLAELGRHAGSLVALSGDSMLASASGEACARRASGESLMRVACKTLCLGVESVCDLISESEDRCYEHIDFADLRFALHDGGLVRMGVGTGHGRRRAEEAARNALASPLLDGVSLHCAKCLLYTIVGPSDISGEELETIGETFRGEVPEDTQIYFSILLDSRLADEIRVVMFATGYAWPDAGANTPS